MDSKGTVLLVEDNKSLNDANTQALQMRGYTVFCAENLAEAREQLTQTEPDVILLDVMLPDGNGFDFCEEIRNKTKAYILFLTAKTSHEDMVRGLSGGGDNYITKPFHAEEMIVKVDAAVRRMALNKAPVKTLSVGNLTLDVITGQAFVGGTEIVVTQREFSLLLVFVQNAGKTISMEDLYRTAWGAPMLGDKKALQRRVSDLKNKLMQGKCSHGITTAYGTGYQFTIHNSQFSGSVK